MPANGSVEAQGNALDASGGMDTLIALAERWRLLVLGPLLGGLIALGISYLVPKTFTARASFLPPQQQLSSAAGALASLGALSGLAGSAINVRSPVDQYVALMQSATVANRIIDRYKLMEVYEADYRFEAREELARNIRIAAGKKDGMISVEADDTNPQRAADIANRYVDELRELIAGLALTEAQQRRKLFQSELEKTQARLTQAQQALQASGFNAGALKAEPKAAAESYAHARAEVTAAEVRLQMIRQSLTDSAPEAQQQQAQLGALRALLAKVESSTGDGKGPDYIGKFREFKYQETLFELFSRQYEMARLDESREGALIQVVDRATTPEWKSRPKRAFWAALGGVVSLVLIIGFVLFRRAWRSSLQDPAVAASTDALGQH
jgi:uncharacterized protein involved in exopolysaccharide biosynthesis